MRLSDYVMQYLVEKDICDIFLVSGGGIMYLVDSAGNTPGLRYYCNYHEQACAICAELYTRVTGRIGVCLVTTGPGGTNALSGVAGAWVDSIAMLVISGQVRRDLIANYSKIRQIGPQEGNLIDMARPVTKYAVTVRDPNKIKYELEKALYLAVSDRPGPVWVEIPLDVQGSEIDESQLESFVPPQNDTRSSRAQLIKNVQHFIELINVAKRPLFLFGNGIHISHSEGLIGLLMERIPFPIVLPNTAKDLVPEDHPNYLGIFGAAGQRRANFALQNADCLIGLALGLNVTKTGFNIKGFGSKATKILVDIDEGQLFHQVLKPDYGILSDIHDFLIELLAQIETNNIRFSPSPKWIEACHTWKVRYPLLLDEYFQDTEHVNSYVFMDKLSDLLLNDDILVTGNGLDEASYWQAFKVKKGQRTLLNGNWGSMGWDLPAAVGACVGSGRRTICVTGDGSLQWNIQELLTVHHYNLPVKLFVFNNQGYTNIRTTQANFFGRYVGADKGSGVSNPEFAHIAAAYGLTYSSIRNHNALGKGIRRALSIDGPTLCEVNIAVGQGIIPKASAFKREDGTIESRPLEDMYPYLPREEIWENMHMFKDGD
jgi:acetolactate synthase-1/2/3 large subunit